MRHLLDIESLSRHEIYHLLARAELFKQGKAQPKYPDYTVAQLFYENSTRTRVSFTRAAQRLGMATIHLDMNYSSEKKGETLQDTLLNLAAMDIQLFVLRHSQEKILANLAPIMPDNIHLINAGDGMHAHPSQALLDMMTILSHFPNPHQLKIALIGNLRHSRVANSLQCLCAKLEVKTLSLVAPPAWQPAIVHYGEVTTSLEKGLADADVIMCLRIQRERLQSEDDCDLSSYRRNFAITADRLTQAKPHAIIMHPGPVNHDVELDSILLTSPQSCILEQVSNGVFMRMAILEALSTANSV